MYFSCFFSKLSCNLIKPDIIPSLPAHWRHLSCQNPSISFTHIVSADNSQTLSRDDWNVISFDLSGWMLAPHSSIDGIISHLCVVRVSESIMHTLQLIHDNYNDDGRLWIFSNLQFFSTSTHEMLNTCYHRRYMPLLITQTGLSALSGVCIRNFETFHDGFKEEKYYSHIFFRKSLL